MRFFLWVTTNEVWRTQVKAVSWPLVGTADTRRIGCSFHSPKETDVNRQAVWTPESPASREPRGWWEDRGGTDWRWQGCTEWVPGEMGAEGRRRARRAPLSQGTKWRRGVSAHVACLGKGEWLGEAATWLRSDDGLEAATRLRSDDGLE